MNDSTTKTFVILNARGLVIGTAEANNSRAAIVAWNRKNVQSPEFATDAYEKEPARRTER